MPFFSVVIPLYNKKNYIAATLQSVLAQTFTDFEIIVINDVSTDNSLSMVQAVNDSRIRVVSHEKNSGLSASRNTGIKNATADYVAFLDADDLWKPQFLEKIQQLIINYPEADIYGSNYCEVYPNNVIIKHPTELKTGLIDNFFKSGIHKHIYCYSSISFRKNIFEKVGYFNEEINMGEDIDFNVKANLTGILAYIDEPLADITMFSENQITHSSLLGKTIIDHDYYEKSNPENAPLKKYLDFHRYTMANRYKLAGDDANYQKMVKAIQLSNLNYKQTVLLYAPVFLLKFIKKMKAALIRKGINPTTY